MKKESIKQFLKGFAILAIILLLLGVVNFVVYEALVGIFKISTSISSLILAITLAFLTLIFIPAMFVGRKFYNFASRSLYYVSSVWLGVFSNLFFASVAYGLIVFVTHEHEPLVGMALVIAAMGVSLYGILHARDIKITKVSVTLPHLPPVWKNRKAIWISDIHLGQIHSLSYAKKIVEKINLIPHDIVFIGGDLFDGAEAHDIKELAHVFGKLNGKLGTYFVTGNHEEYGNVAAFVSAVKSAKIRVLFDEKVEIEGLQLIGVDYAHASDKDSFRKILSSLSIESNKPSILLKHEPKDIDVVCEAGISLQISGHTHNGQMWPFMYLANRTYKGFGYGLKKTGETQVYTSSGVGTWGPPLRIGTISEIVVITFEA